MKKIILGILLSLFITPAFAVVPKEFDTKENRVILNKVEKMLHSIKTMKSRFSEFTSKDGDFMKHGNFYLSRPNKMRLIYDAPSDIEFVADGMYFIYYDKGFDQVSFLEIDQTPAAILLKPDFTFDDPEFTVTNIVQDLDEYHISAVKTKEPELGELTLITGIDPVDFRQWELVDAKGIKSTVGLYETEMNKPVDESLFVFKKKK
ncbi:MAG: outer membrane lipoprotein carrier protein LolA [Alphaproteobacteria bacterium]|nr:outer membrane lipoprotein carrier protein LolA [Alphaproteobacteria bacterium]